MLQKNNALFVWEDVYKRQALYPYDSDPQYGKTCDESGKRTDRIFFRGLYERNYNNL